MLKLLQQYSGGRLGARTGTPADTAEDLQNARQQRQQSCASKGVRTRMQQAALTRAQTQNIRLERPFVLNFIGLRGGVPVLQIRRAVGVRVRYLQKPDAGVSAASLPH
jgi:hypothetical protein